MNYRIKLKGENMSVESNIILITNDEDVVQVLKPKLVLLREIDNILPATYTEAINKINETLPEIVLLYCAENEREECLELIKQIKSNEEIKGISILLIVDKYNQDFVLSAFDENISDYLKIDTDDVELLMRTIWCIKKSLLINTIKKQNTLLQDLAVIDKNTGFYNNEHCDKIFENEFKNLKKYALEGVLMLVSASEECKTKLSPFQLAKAIRNSTRESDILVNGTANRFYVLLRETNLKGAFCVWDKIKRNVGETYTLNAGISIIGEKAFETLKTELLNALVEANSTKQEVIIVSEEESSSDNWLDKINSSQKNFKLFKQAFSKKLEKVITPVFFQVQKVYEEKLFEVAIEQYSNATLSSFLLKKNDKVSELRITYPGFSKINIDIIHQGLDSPENKRISLDLTELDEAKLTQILEEFIEEYKSGCGD